MISCDGFLIVWIDYTYAEISFDRYNQVILIEEAEWSGNWKTEQRNRFQKPKKGMYIWASSKKDVLWIKQPKQVKQQVTPPIQILMLTYHNQVNQAAVKRWILECISEGEKVMLILQMRKWKKNCEVEDI